MAAPSEKASSNRTTDLSISDMRCITCNTEYSPFFHPVDVKEKPESQAQTYECHACHFNKIAQRPMEQPQETQIASEIQSTAAVTVGA